MARIVFIGAGSVVFTRQLVADLLSFPDLLELDLVLHDINPARLDVARGTAQQLAARTGRPLRITAAADRRTALDGADFVVNMIQVGGVDASRVDLELPNEFGLRQTIGDTTGIGGVFRALRTFPVLSGIARDMRAVCPEALFLNYTNPMTMNIWWLATVSPDLRTAGLCHSVFWTVHDLCALIGVPLEGTRFRAAGVNHQSWLYEWSQDGADLYPQLREKIAAAPELERRVRVEIFRRIGYYPTETSEHSAEYLSWFLRSDEQIDRFRLRPMQHLDTDRRNLAEFHAAQQALAEGRDLELENDGGASEYAPQVIHSVVTGTEREIHVNVPNRGLISNLPQGAVVEVPATVDRSGIAPIAVGAITVQGAVHNRTYLSVAELAVEAALTGSRDLVLQAMLVDPNASSTLTPDRLAALVDELFKIHQDLLPSTLGGGVELDLSDVPNRS